MKTIPEMLKQLDAEIAALDKRIIGLMVARDSLREVHEGGGMPAPEPRARRAAEGAGAPDKVSRRALIASRAKGAARTVQVCSVCGEAGHNKRRCSAEAPAQ